MDGHRMDRLARSLATGMSRRAAMKTVAVGLGLAAAGAQLSPASAAPATWRVCQLRCTTDEGLDEYIKTCMNKACPAEYEPFRYHGRICEFTGTTMYPLTKKHCESIPG